MRDTKYTSPDSLRDLYQNPKNPLKDLDEVGQAALAIVRPTAQPIVGGGSPSGGGSPGGGGFPGGAIGGHKVPPLTDDFQPLEEQLL